MKVIALIPARYNSSRFPGKMLAKLNDKSVILTTYLVTKNMKLFDDVIVVTDSEEIYNEITNNGGKTIYSKKYHNTGTDRIAEAAEIIDTDIVFNVQGDTPFINKDSVAKLISSFEDKSVDVATIVQKIENEEDIRNPNNVKLIKDLNDFVMYFSRSVIPFNRDNMKNINYYKHIGIYAFRKSALMKFSKLEQTPNEIAEKIEPIRFLENGMKIKVFETNYVGIEIDTPEDLVKANDFLKNNKL